MTKLNITVDFINTLRESQEQLYKEISMNKVESFEVRRETDHLIKLFNQSRINQKEYFSLIYRTLNPSILSNTFCKIESIIDPNQIEPSPTQSKKISILIEFALDYTEESQQQKANDLRQFFIDTLTFSIIPSYYNFFWTDYSIKSLYKMFSYVNQKENDEFYDNLARVAFLTPNFIRFSELCFQPAFSKILSSHVSVRNINKENLIRDIQFNIKEYQNFIPDETLVVLACSSNPLRTLVNSFFKIALSTPISSQIYGFFHYSYNKKKYESFLNFLREIFSSKYYDSYIKSIMDAITCDTVVEKSPTIFSRYKEIKKMYASLFEDVDDFNEINDEVQELNEFQLKLDDNNSQDDLGSFLLDDDEGTTLFRLTSSLFENSQNKIADLQKIEPIENKYHLFSLSNIFNNKEIFQTKLLSSIDIDYIKIASGSLKRFKLPKKIQYYNDYKSEYQNNIIQASVSESTRIGRAFLIAPMIRHLLQRADPIPTFKSVPTNFKISDFIYSFLVKRGEISYRQEREMQFNQMISMIPSNRLDEKTVKSALSCISFKRMNPIRLLSNFTSIEMKLQRMNDMIDTQFSEIQVVIEANDKLYEKFTALRRPIEYIKTPSFLAEDFDSSVQKITLIPDFNQTRNFPKILFASISEKVDIVTFAAQRDKTKKLPRPLKEYDEKFKEKAVQHFLDFLRDEFYSHCTNSSFSQFNEWSYLASKISSVPVEKNEILEILNDAFQESSLMRKVERISIAMNLFFKHLSSGFPPNKILDSDQLTPSSIALILCANPPMAITNLAYLHDMMPTELDVSNIFGGFATTFPNYLKFTVAQIIPELEKEF